MEAAFRGAGRRALVDRLVAAFDEVVASDRPAWVSLEAGSGWGKTRLVQELYATLAGRQAEPAYWPPTILGAVGAGADLDAPDGRRKRVHPEAFTAPGDALPHWFWWGISASTRMGGAPVAALADDLAQVRVHADALERRWREVAGTGRRVRRALGGDDAREVGRAIGDEAFGNVVEAVAGAAVPGLGLLVLAGEIAWRHRDRWRGRPDELTVDTTTRTDEDLVEQLAAQLRTFASGGVPVVVVVEDVHDADDTLATLLVRVLAAGTGPVLVVTTAWPGLLDDPARPAHRLAAEVPPDVATRLVAPDGLPPLDDDDLARLVADVLPGADAGAAHRLAARLGNPLAVELACSLPRIADAVRSGDLGEDDLDRLPRDVADLYRAVFQTLPTSVRDALMLAVLSSPAGIGDLLPDRTWDPQVVARAAATVPWLADEAEDLAAQLAGQATAYAWVRRVDEWLRTCNEPAQHDVALDEAVDHHGRRRHRELCSALAASIDLDDPELPPARRRHLAGLLVTLAAEDLTDWTDAAVRACDLLVLEASELWHVDGQRRVLALVDALPRSLRRRDPDADLARRHLRARALADLGRHEEALAAARELEADVAERYGGRDQPAVLRVRQLVARLLGDTAAMDEAAAHRAALLEDMDEVFGPDHDETLDVLSHLANARSWSGDVDGAIEALLELDARYEAAGRHTPASRAEVRMRLAQQEAVAGRLDQAVAQARRALGDQRAAAGDDDVATAAMAAKLASILREAGLPDEAATLLDGVVAVLGRALGVDHPLTLGERTSLALARAEAGRPDMARPLLAELVKASGRVRGRDHLETWRLRSTLAHCDGLLGDPHRAIEGYREALAARADVLGADDPQVLVDRLHLAGWLAHVGDHAAAAEQAGEVAARRAAVLGPAHPATLAAAQQQGVSLLEAARLPDAIAVYEAAIAAAAAAGAPPSALLQLRAQCAVGRRLAGDEDRGRAELQAVLDEARAIHPPDHPLVTDLEAELGPG